MLGKKRLGGLTPGEWTRGAGSGGEAVAKEKGREKPQKLAAQEHSKTRGRGWCREFENK